MVLLSVLALAVTAVVIALNNLSSAPPLVQRCVATLGDDHYTLDPDQADHVALFAAMATERELPPRAVTVAIATGMQESRLRNIDHGDRDSLGLFQQRPSQGWGTEEQIMDPVYATGAFYDALVQIDGWQEMDITVAAQAVQRSGFPDAYAQHEPMARAFAAALTGQTTASLGCTLAPVERPDAEAVGTETGADPGVPAGAETAVAATVGARLERELPSVQVLAGESGADASGTGDPDSGASDSDDPVATPDADEPYLVLDATDLAGADDGEALWRVAHWLVASAWATEVSEVIVGDLRWERGEREWLPVQDAPIPGPGHVLVR